MAGLRQACVYPEVPGGLSLSGRSTQLTAALATQGLTAPFSAGPVAAAQTLLPASPGGRHTPCLWGVQYTLFFMR